MSLYFGRKNPLFYLIFPIALISGIGAFINPSTVFFDFSYYDKQKNLCKDVIIIYLLIIFIFNTSKKYNISVTGGTPFSLYSFYILFLIIFTFTSPEKNFDYINIIRLFTHIILGYYLILLIISSSSLNQFLSFINYLLWANFLLSICYTLNSSNLLNIYPKKSLYQEIESGNNSFFRDFETIPYFSNLLFLISLSSKIFKIKLLNNKALLANLVIYPIVLLFTFTRGLLFNVIIEVIIIIAISVRYKSNLLDKRFLAYIFVAFFLIGTSINIVFSKQLGYFDERISSARKNGKSEENVNIRTLYHIIAYNELAKNNELLFGGGLSKKHEKNMNKTGAWTVDSTIPFLLIYTGILGVILFFYIGLFFLKYLWIRLFNHFNPINLSLFAIIFVTTLSNLFNGGNNWGDPFIFFNYSLVIGFNYLLKENLRINKFSKISLKSSNKV